jgi:methanogenic corrinoid protein MtbC1
MFRWCSFCQTFIGESEPRSDFSMTHGICKSCKANYEKVSENVENIRPIRAFFLEICEKFEKKSINAEDLFNRAKQLNIKSSDFLAGLIQPMLYQIGHLYETKKIKVADEHEFTCAVETLLSLIRREMNQKLSTTSPEIIIASADGDYHSLGIQFLELALLDSGISCKAIYPSVPVTEVLELAKSYNTRFIGLSVTNTTVRFGA